MEKLERRKCSYPNCNKLGRNKGFRNGIKRYDKLCSIHHTYKYYMNNNFYKSLNEKTYIKNNKCEICGWDECPCDRHRLDNTKGYNKENVIVLCPNCHRKAHYNKINLKNLTKDLKSNTI